jgi:hypothetical protein
MKTKYLSIPLLSFFLLGIVAPASAAEIAAPSAPVVDTKANTKSKSKVEAVKPTQIVSGEKIVYNPPVSPESKIVYVPPMRGAPSVRVTGASRSTRGGVETQVFLCALAPEHTGWTTQESPSLFWYQSEPANAKFELTLLDGEKAKAKPLLFLTMSASEMSGIQRVRLKDHNIKLEPNVEYQWIVAIVVSNDARSCDIVSSAWIKRVGATEKLQAQLKSANQEQKAIIYANQGLWYDALETLSDEIDTKPKENGFREMRCDLLRQVGLKAASTFDSALLKSADSQASADMPQR